MSVFGDLKFYSSRAFLDDDLEEDEEYELPVLRWAVEEQSTTDGVTSVIVSFGPLANGYCLQEIVGGKDKSIGCITATQSTDTTSEVAEIFLCDEDRCLLVVCQDTKESQLANPIANLIVGAVPKQAPITVLTSQHISKLTAAVPEHFQEGEFVISKSVSSPEFGGTLRARALPQPAVVENIPAAVLTHAVMRYLPCVVYVVYTETISSDDVDNVREEMNRLLARKSTGKSFKTYSRKKDCVNIPDIYI